MITKKTIKLWINPDPHVLRSWTQFHSEDFCDRNPLIGPALYRVDSKPEFYWFREDGSPGFIESLNEDL